MIDFPHYNRYKLRTKYDIIKHLYPTGQLNVVPEELQEGLKEILFRAEIRTCIRTTHYCTAGFYS